MPKGYQTYVGAWDGVNLDHSNLSDTTPLTLGARMKNSVGGRVVGVQFFRDLNDGGEHVGVLLNAALEILDVVLFHRNAASGAGADKWHKAYFRKTHRFAANEVFVIAVFFGEGKYWSDTSLVAGAPFVNGHMTITQDGDGGANGLFSYGKLTPTDSFSSSVYGVDCLFLEDVP